MIDLNFLREDPKSCSELIKKKDPSFTVDELIDLDQEVRALMLEIESLRHKKNELAKVGKSGITEQIRSEAIALSQNLKKNEAVLEEKQKKFHELYMRCPNVPLPELPEGGKESNRTIKEWGKKPEFSFPIKNHLELGTNLQWFDFQTAATMSGNNFAFYKGEGVKLIYALKMFMLKHNEMHGYSYILPPYLVTEKSLEIASNFPKFREDVYATNDNLYLIPTAEVNLANMYRDRIFSVEELPLRLTAATSCFRREAGGYGANERGLLRIHQFEKVELFTYCLPDESENELNRMVSCAEGILRALGLHYRITLLAAQDCSFSSAKTYDIEVWLPGQNRYMEVSSCSMCTTFQSRRGGMRYRSAVGSKTHYVHTLNGSSLAQPRLIAALMETYQQADGSVVLPEVLKEYGLY
jgi:seryl-tRNA synthetase